MESVTFRIDSEEIPIEMIWVHLQGGDSPDARAFCLTVPLEHVKGLFDPHGIESEAGSHESGFGFVSDEIVFEPSKRLAKGAYELFGQTLSGYEIHCGVSAKHPLGFESENFLGTHLHGIFENDDFRTSFLRRFCAEYEGFEYETHKQNELQTLVNTVRNSIDTAKIIKALSC